MEENDSDDTIVILNITSLYKFINGSEFLDKCIYNTFGIYGEWTEHCKK